MAKNDRWFIIGCLAVGIIVAIAAYVMPIPPEPCESWHRSSTEFPPEDRPIVGFWILDGEPSPMPAVCINRRFYAYNPGGPALLIAEYPPSYWVDMPGVAK